MPPIDDRIKALLLEKQDEYGYADIEMEVMADQVHLLLGVHANVCAAIGPRKIVIAGGVSRIGEPILVLIRKTIRERVTIMPVEQVEVVGATLGDDAGVIDTGLWASNNIS